MVGHLAYPQVGHADDRDAQVSRGFHVDDVDADTRPQDYLEVLHRLHVPTRDGRVHVDDPMGVASLLDELITLDARQDDLFRPNLLELEAFRLQEVAGMHADAVDLVLVAGHMVQIPD